MSKKKKVLIAFLGNLNYDSRCKNLYDTLTANNYNVEFIGFDWLTKDFKTQLGDVTIHKLRKGKFSLGYYIAFIYRLKMHLLKSRSTIFFAEDIYTLPFTVFFGKLKRARVFYDSRELFGHLAGLRKKKFIQKIFQLTEIFFIKHVDYVIVTGEMDAEFIKEKYGISNIIVLRNLPRYYKPQRVVNLKQQLNIDKPQKILLYQGVILHGRGLTPAFKALKELEDFSLVILGGGEFSEYYKGLAKDMGLGNRVFFLGKVKQEEVLQYTTGADIGLALIENISLSYYYALPNKLFEYIMAEVPVIASNLPQMKKIVDEYQVGLTVDLEKPDELIAAIKSLSENPGQYNKYKDNCKTASLELNWETEAGKLLSVL